MTEYSFKFRPFKFLDKIVTSQTSKSFIVESDHMSNVTIRFDTDLTTGEKDAILAAMPQIVKDLFEITVE